jgi:hypothetical protein
MEAKYWFAQSYSIQSRQFLGSYARAETRQRVELRAARSAITNATLAWQFAAG